MVRRPAKTARHAVKEIEKSLEAWKVADPEIDRLLRLPPGAFAKRSALKLATAAAPRAGRRLSPEQEAKVREIIEDLKKKRTGL